MTQTVRLLLGDQLSRDISSLGDLDVERDVVLMAEVMAEATYVRHHPKKIAFVFSAMRHFADALKAEGVTVEYVRLDDPDNSGSLAGEAQRAVARHGAAKLAVTEPGEWRLAEEMAGWQERLGLPVEVRDDSRFFCSRAAFADWAEGRKSLRMEHFYREMRRSTGLLMEPDGKPVGDRWNLDQENRKAIPPEVEAPPRHGVEPDAITQDVIDLVAERFGHHFGTLDGFDFAVTADDAKAGFEHFVTHALPRFGDYQDAMRLGDPLLFHARIGVYLNAGLLSPQRVCERAEQAWREGDAPLNAVEGFIRQILGWREYVRGIYWLKMPDYAARNALSAERRLPEFYWTGETDMACLRDCVEQTRREAHAHHIQRLMVLGNFALLAGVDPAAVNYWYMVVYADAYEWVELPNVHGMAIHADGGVMASKPYAASGKYIDRMSDYCKHCRYDPKKQLEKNACPFNALYWRFIMTHRETFQGNPRMAFPLKTLDRMTPEKREALHAKGDGFLEGLSYAEPGAW